MWAHCARESSAYAQACDRYVSAAVRDIGGVWRSLVCVVGRGLRVLVGFSENGRLMWIPPVCVLRCDLGEGVGGVLLLLHWLVHLRRSG